MKFCFQPLFKLKRVDALCSRSSLVLDLFWVLENASNDPDLTSSTFAVLSKMTFASDAVRTSLREGRALPKLAAMLNEKRLPTAGVLDLLRNVCYGIRVDREESFLHQLIPNLVE